MNECRFCRDLADIKTLNRKSSRKVNMDPGLGFRIRHICTVRIRVDTYRSGAACRNHAGTYTFGRYPVHYCPVCGKRIARERIT